MLERSGVGATVELAALPRSPRSRACSPAASATPRSPACSPAATTTNCASPRRRRSAAAARRAGNELGVPLDAHRLRSRPRAGLVVRDERGRALAALPRAFDHFRGLIRCAPRPTLTFLFAHPAHFIALGFGTGLSPIAPGHRGHARRAAARRACCARSPMTSGSCSAVVVAFAVGIWAAQRTGRDLGVARSRRDRLGRSGGVSAGAVFRRRRSAGAKAFAFLLFRFFDIVKPPPGAARSTANGITASA